MCRDSELAVVVRMHLGLDRKQEVVRKVWHDRRPGDGRKEEVGHREPPGHRERAGHKNKVGRMLVLLTAPLQAIPKFLASRSSRRNTRQGCGIAEEKSKHDVGDRIRSSRMNVPGDQNHVANPNDKANR